MRLSVTLLLLLTACAPVELSSARLSVSTSATPTQIPSGDSVPLVVVIRVANWRPWPIRINIGGPPWQTLHDIPTSTGQGFAVFLRHADGAPTNVNRTTWGRSDLRLGPFQYIRWVDTVWVNTPRRPLPPGKYELITGFGRTPGRPIPVLVTP